MFIDGAVHRTRVSLVRGERALWYLRLNNVGLAENIESQKPESAHLRKCGGCADDSARKLGADVAITGEIAISSRYVLSRDQNALRAHLYQGGALFRLSASLFDESGGCFAPRNSRFTQRASGTHGLVAASV